MPFQRRRHADGALLAKTVSLSLIAALLLTSTVTPSDAALMVHKTAVPSESSIAKELSPPPELGWITDYWTAPSVIARRSPRRPTKQSQAGTTRDRFGRLDDLAMTRQNPLVVLIQDLHAHYETQSKIAQLLEFYDRKLSPPPSSSPLEGEEIGGGASYKVAVEGAEGPILVTELGKLRDRAFKAEVCDYLMKEAELTGTEYFAIVNGKPDILWGVEDELHHLANLELFRSTFHGKEAIATSLEKLQREFEPVKKKYFSWRMRRWEKKTAAARSGKISLAEYTGDLARQAARRGIDIARHYPEIAQWTGYAAASRYVNLDQLFAEQADLLRETQMRLAKTDLQRNVALVTYELYLLKRFVTQQASTAEVRKLAPHLPQVLGRVKYLLDSVGLPYDKANLEELISANVDFYAMALLRDKFLAENTLQLLRAQDPEHRRETTPRNDSLKTVVLVAGGFHTPGITQIFKEKGVSYLVVTPTLTDAQVDRDLYDRRLMGEHVTLDQSGSPHMLWLERNSREIIDTILTVFARRLAQRKGLTKALELLSNLGQKWRGSVERIQGQFALGRSSLSSGGVAALHVPQGMFAQSASHIKPAMPGAGSSGSGSGSGNSPISDTEETRPMSPARSWDMLTETPPLIADFSHDGSLLAVGTRGSEEHDSSEKSSEIVLIDADGSFRLPKRLEGHGQYARALAFHPKEKILATSGTDGILRVWNLQDPRNPRLIGEPFQAGGEVWSLAFSPDGVRLAGGLEDGQAWILKFDGQSWRPYFGGKFSLHDDPVISTTFHPSGNRFASAGVSNGVKVWRFNEQGAPVLVKELRDTRWPIAFSPNGKWLATGGEEGTLKLFQVSIGKGVELSLVNTMAKDKGLTTIGKTAAFSPDGKFLATVGEDQRIRLWDVQALTSGQETAPVLLKGPEKPINSIAFRPDGTSLIATDREGIVHEWERDKDASVQRLLPMVTAIAVVALLTSVLAAFADDGGLTSGSSTFWRRVATGLAGACVTALFVGPLLTWWKAAPWRNPSLAKLIHAYPDLKDFSLSRTHRRLRRHMQAFAAENVAPRAAALDASNDIDTVLDLLKEMTQPQGRNGPRIVGATIPPKYGGSGLDIVSETIMTEELTRGSQAIALIHDVGTALTAFPLLHYGTSEQKDRYLKPLVNGEFLLSFALTEPDAGSDADSLTTSFTEENDAFVIDGRKRFITVGSAAQYAIVFARDKKATNPDHPSRAISAFIVPLQQKDLMAHSGPVTVQHMDTMMGHHGTGTAEIAFDNVRIPKENLLGQMGQGFEIAMKTLEAGRISISAIILGSLETSLEEMISAYRQRLSFRSIAPRDEALWKETITGMMADALASRLLLLNAARKRQSNQPYNLEAALAKLKPSEDAVRNAAQAMVLVGPDSLRSGPSRLERDFRDAKLLTIGEGTTEVLRTVVAKELRGRGPNPPPLSATLKSRLNLVDAAVRNSLTQLAHLYDVASNDVYLQGVIERRCIDLFSEGYALRLMAQAADRNELARHLYEFAQHRASRMAAAYVSEATASQRHPLDHPPLNIALSGTPLEWVEAFIPEVRKVTEDSLHVVRKPQSSPQGYVHAGDVQGIHEKLLPTLGKTGALGTTHMTYEEDEEDGNKQPIPLGSPARHAILEAIAETDLSAAAVVLEQEKAIAVLQEHGQGMFSELLADLMKARKVAGIAWDDLRKTGSQQAIAYKADANLPYEIVGRKSLVANAGTADIFIVLAEIADAGLSAFVVEKGDGVEVSAGETLGLRGALLRDIRFSNAKGLLLGEPGKGMEALQTLFQVERDALPFICRGASRTLFIKAHDYARIRLINKNPTPDKAKATRATAIIELPPVEEHLQVILDHARQMTQAETLNPTALLVDTANRALQVFGGSGYSEEEDTARFLRDAQTLDVLNADAQRARNPSTQTMNLGPDDPDKTSDDEVRTHPIHPEQGSFTKLKGEALVASMDRQYSTLSTVLAVQEDPDDGEKSLYLRSLPRASEHQPTPETAALLEWFQSLTTTRRAGEESSQRAESLFRRIVLDQIFNHLERRRQGSLLPHADPYIIVSDHPDLIDAKTQIVNTQMGSKQALVLNKNWVVEMLAIRKHGGELGERVTTWLLGEALLHALDHKPEIPQSLVDWRTDETWVFLNENNRLKELMFGGREAKPENLTAYGRLITDFFAAHLIPSARSGWLYDPRNPEAIHIHAMNLALEIDRLDYIRNFVEKTLSPDATFSNDPVRTHPIAPPTTNQTGAPIQTEIAVRNGQTFEKQPIVLWRAKHFISQSKGALAMRRTMAAKKHAQVVVYAQTQEELGLLKKLERDGFEQGKHYDLLIHSQVRDADMACDLAASQLTQARVTLAGITVYDTFIEVPAGEALSWAIPGTKLQIVVRLKEFAAAIAEYIARARTERRVRQRTGGPSHSAARVLAQLSEGSKLLIRHISRVGRKDGAGARASLRKLGVNTSGMREAPAPTATTQAWVYSDAESPMTHVLGASNYARGEDLRDEDYPAEVVGIHGCELGKGFMRDVIGVLRKAKAAGAIVTWDTVVDPFRHWEKFTDQKFDEILSHIDIFIPSIGEARSIIENRLRRLGWSNADAKACASKLSPEEIVRYFMLHGSQSVFLKMGKNGCLVRTTKNSVFGEDRTLRLPILKVIQSKDGTGAGDAFAAAVIKGYLMGWSVEKTALLATTTGALATKRFGGTLGHDRLADVLHHAEMFQAQEDVQEALERSRAGVDGVRTAILDRGWLASRASLRTPIARVRAQISQAKAIVRIDAASRDQAVQAGRIAAEWGLIPEVRFDADATTARQTIRDLARNLKKYDMPLIAENVTTVEQVKLAHRAGAGAITCPGVSRPVVKAARSRGLAVIVQVTNPIEAYNAALAGADFLRLPADPNPEKTLEKAAGIRAHIPDARILIAGELSHHTVGLIGQQGIMAFETSIPAGGRALASVFQMAERLAPPAESWVITAREELKEYRSLAADKNLFNPVAGISEVDSILRALFSEKPNAEKIQRDLNRRRQTIRQITGQLSKGSVSNPDIPQFLVEQQLTLEAYQDLIRFLQKLGDYLDKCVWKIEGALKKRLGPDTPLHTGMMLQHVDPSQNISRIYTIAKVGVENVWLERQQGLGGAYPIELEKWHRAELSDGTWSRTGMSEWAVSDERPPTTYPWKEEAAMLHSGQSFATRLPPPDAGPAAHNVRTFPLVTHSDIVLIEPYPGYGTLYASELLAELENPLVGNRIYTLTVSEKAQNLSRIASRIRDIKPAALVLPHPHDPTELVQKVRRVAAEAAADSAQLEFCYETPEMLLAGFNFFCTFTENGMERKVKGILEHSSQVDRLPFQEAARLSNRAAALMMRFVLRDGTKFKDPYAERYVYREMREDGELHSPNGPRKMFVSAEGVPGNKQAPPPFLQRGSRGTVVFFAPHPDDDVIAAGALLARLKKQGHRVVVVTLTTGHGAEIPRPVFEDYVRNHFLELKKRHRFKNLQEALSLEGGTPLFKEVVKDLREAEIKSAAQAVGLDPDDCISLRCNFYDRRNADGSRILLEDDLRRVRMVLNHIYKEYETQATENSRFLVVLPQDADKHPDHQATLEAVMKAQRNLARQKKATIDNLFYVSPWHGETNLNHYFPVAGMRRKGERLSGMNPDRLAAHEAAMRANALVGAELVGSFGASVLQPEQLGGPYAERYWVKPFQLWKAREEMDGHVIKADDEDEMGKTAAIQIIEDWKRIIAQKGKAVTLFASAPSQHSTWRWLVTLGLQEIRAGRLDPSKIVAFHMDEYVGLEPGAEQLFGKNLKEKLFEKLGITNVHYFDDRVGYDTAVALRVAIQKRETDRIEALTKELEAQIHAHVRDLAAKFAAYGGVFDVVVGGIGVHPHLAFNDAPGARFDDPETIKVVRLTETSRQQQVDDKEFKRLLDVPTHAVTFTLPPILNARHIHIMVPRAFKALAVRDTLDGEITENVPASGLRLRRVLPNVTFYLDPDSARLSKTAAEVGYKPSHPYEDPPPVNGDGSFQVALKPLLLVSAVALLTSAIGAFAGEHRNMADPHGGSLWSALVVMALIAAMMLLGGWKWRASLSALGSKWLAWPAATSPLVEALSRPWVGKDGHFSNFSKSISRHARQVADRLHLPQDRWNRQRAALLSA